MSAPAAAAAASDASAASASAADSSSISKTIISGITIYNDYEHHLERIQPDSHPAPFLLKSWLEAHASEAGKQSYVYDKDCQFQLQVRTGPQVMQAFHVQSGEEWIYVMSGAAELRVLDGRSVKTLPLPSGMCYLVPGGTPKSLCLPEEGSTVLVMTRQRKTAEADSYPNYNKNHRVPHLTDHNGNAQEPLDQPDQLLWKCPTCGAIAFKQEFTLTEYFSQTAALADEFKRNVAAGSVSCASCSAPYTLDGLAGAATCSQDLPASSAPFPTIVPATHMAPYHLFGWVDANRHLLAPPVGNKMISGLGAQWKVMIVGGPNERTDYHIDDGEEWFLMIEGDMTLKIVDGDEFKDVVIKQGESFLLPANVPHSPQRKEKTIGLVIERERFSYELDGLRWYCSNASCRRVLHTFSFKCADLGTQLKVLIAAWYEETPEAVNRRTCKHCGQVEQKPDTLAKIKQFTH